MEAAKNYVEPWMTRDEAEAFMWNLCVFCGWTCLVLTVCFILFPSDREVLAADGRPVRPAQELAIPVRLRQAVRDATTCRRWC